jgi:hypothetical protein
MQIKSDRLIREFYQSISEEFPHLSLEDISNICTAPFIYLRHIVEKGIMTVVHFKYLGKFLIYPGRVKGLIKSLHIQRERGMIDEEKYNKKLKQLEEYLTLHYEELSKTDSEWSETID